MGLAPILLGIINPSLALTYKTVQLVVQLNSLSHPAAVVHRSLIYIAGDVNSFTYLTLGLTMGGILFNKVRTEPIIRGVLELAFVHLSRKPCELELLEQLSLVENCLTILRDSAFQDHVDDVDHDSADSGTLSITDGSQAPEPASGDPAVVTAEPLVSEQVLGGILFLRECLLRLVRHDEASLPVLQKFQRRCPFDSRRCVAGFYGSRASGRFIESIRARGGSVALLKRLDRHLAAPEVTAAADEVLQELRAKGRDGLIKALLL